VGRQEHVPETKDPKPNRAMRRHPDKLDPVEAVRVREEQEEILKRGTDDDVSVREELGPRQEDRGQVEPVAAGAATIP
jgi:hypothetical protein